MVIIIFIFEDFNGKGDSIGDLWIVTYSDRGVKTNWIIIFYDVTNNNWLEN